MKKNFRKILGMLIILGSISISLFASKLEATTLNMSYEKSNSSTEENIKETYIKPGEEVFINVSIDANNNTQNVMSIYGNFEFDNNVLELVKSENNEKSAQINLGDGWMIGNLNMEDSKFLVYTSDKDRSDTAFSVKFKVKENCNVDKTTVIIKDIILYNSSQKVIEGNVENINLEIKIDKKDEIAISIEKTCFIIGICIIFIIVLLVLKKKSKNEAELKDSENEKNDINKSKSEEMIENKIEKEEHKDEIKVENKPKNNEENKKNKEIEKTNKNKDNQKDDNDNKENKKTDNKKIENNSKEKNNKKTEKDNQKTEKKSENKKDVNEEK